MAYAAPELTLIGRAAGFVLGTLPGALIDSDPDCPVKFVARETPCQPLGEW